ncbi:MAG TPA: universal stress protein [Egicoccus sp.]|nr:universal stress protein [Egicoccus sp.]HSK24141.1 universal stress protein [Egicoccus sp.]
MTAAYRHVLVGTDGSKTAGRAVTAASRVAASLGVPLVIVTAWQRHLDDPPPLSEESRYPGGNAASQESHWAIDVTSDAAAVARTAGVEDVRQLQPIGSPADALLEVAGRYPEGLLVVGTAGLGDAGERLVGNVPHQLTHHSPLDLLLVGAGPAYEPGWATVALATDGSRTAGVAVERGVALAAALGADPVLLTVARDEDKGRGILDRAAATAGLESAAARRVAVGGDVARSLTAAARDFDLLVIGNKGMSGPSRLLGSVSNRITHEVPTDLLLVNTTR